MTKPVAKPVTGGCLCGAVRFAAEAFLEHAFYCHCTMCQKHAGGPFIIGVPVRTGTLHFTKGEPSWYRSSSFGKRAFCAACGSPMLWARATSEKDWGANISVGALDNPADVRPRYHTYTDTKLPWIEIREGLASFPERHTALEIARWKADWWT